MKKIIVILFILLGITGSAQDSWYYQTPTSVKKLYFIDNNTLIAVGLGIWKSTDRGVSWTGFSTGYQMQQNGISYPLENVDFYSTLIGYAVGSAGKILKTVNGGNSWELKTTHLPAESTNFVDVAAIDFSTAIVLANGNTSSGYGSIIIKTTDGGNSWFNVYEEASVYMNDMEFPDIQTGWATGNYNKILKTTDAGNSWTRFDLDASHPLSLSYCISFKDADNGLISTQSSDNVVRTQDGGASWETISTGYSGFSKSLQYFSNGTAYMLIDGGVILRSADNGSNWSEVGIPSNANYRDIIFSSPSIGIAYGGSGFKYSVTSNGCQQWKLFIFDPGGVTLFDQNNLWATNYFGESGRVSILRSFNGKTWKFIESNTGLPDVRSFGTFQFLNLDEGYSFVSYQSAPNTYSPALLKTTNSGVDWSTISTASGLMDYYFVNSQFGWIVLYGGKIYKTLDYAATWGEQTSGVATALTDVFFIDENIGWISGYSGVLLRTTNGGLLWNSVSITGYSDVNFYALKFYDSNNGYMIGRRNSAGIVLKTNDGGLTWVDITPSELPTYLYGNQFQVKGPSEVYLLSYDDRIFRTGDGGSSWQIINYPGAGASLAVVNSSRIYVETDGILFTENGGVSSVEKLKTVSIPNDFTLFQNYPNPFNPETRINFNLPFDFYGNVNLTVYDILGNKIDEYVNEVMSGGSYEVSFNGNNLSSGIYFYTLSAGNYSSTKKMLLLK